MNTKLDFDYLITFLMLNYNLPHHIGLSILYDFSDNNGNHKLNQSQYEDMIRSLDDIDKEIFVLRIKLFEECDLDTNGYIGETELLKLYEHFNIDPKSTHDLLGLYTINYCMRNFDMNNDGYLNFIDFNSYIRETSLNVYK